jgi:hypothetical protein
VKEQGKDSTFGFSRKGKENPRYLTLAERRKAEISKRQELSEVVCCKRPANIEEPVEAHPREPVA